MKGNPAAAKTFSIFKLLPLACLTFCCFFCLISPLYGATSNTYYVCNNDATCNGGEGSGWSTGNDNNSCTDKSAPCQTLQGGVAKMSGGDTLITGDGIYTGSSNVIARYDSFPYGNNGPDNIDGTADDVYTTVMAEHDGKVIFDGNKFEIYGQEEVDDGGLHLDHTKKCFSTWRGFIFKNHETPLKVGYIKRVKIINCGITGLDVAIDSDYSIFNINRGTYILVEGCYDWGNSGSYIMQTTHSDHVVWRNCVIRPDKNNLTYAQVGALCNYSCSNQLIQNVIILDGDTGIQNLGNYGGNPGLFGNPATSPRIERDYAPNLFYNCIGLNSNQRFGTSDHSNDGFPPGYRNFTKFYNSIGWDLTAPPYAVKNTDPADYFTNSYFGSSGSTSFDQCTFGIYTSSIGEDIPTSSGLFHGTGRTNIMTNSIIHSLDIGSLYRTYEEVDYVNITNFTHNLSVKSPTTIVNNQTNHPLTNLYLPRMDTAALETAGRNGSRIGAEILYQHGKTGTMWGEPGYNLLQDGTAGQDKVELWPFPNEDIIKEQVQSYSYPGDTDHPAINGDRGFASSTAKQLDGTSDVTLTSYIWEYLGNAMPCEIYHTCGDGIAISSLSASNATGSSFEASLNYTGDDNSNGAVTLYYCNETDSGSCAPSTILGTMVRGSRSYTLSVTGLTSPEDPGDTLKIQAIASDSDGVTSSPLNTTVTLSDTTPPALTEIVAIPTYTNDTTPGYTFHSTEAGTISYGGSCSSATTNAISGNNTITFNTLPDSNYSDCTITVTDTVNNTSSLISVKSFEVDTTAPGAISDLTVSSCDTNSCTLTWTSPGDDNTTGYIRFYDIRYSTSAITNDTDFNNATRVIRERLPSIAGGNESFRIRNLGIDKVYYFAIKANDEIPNESAISNVARGETISVPVIETIPNDSITQGNTYTLTPTLSLGTKVKWRKAYGHDDISVDPGTGQISWDIPADLPGEAFYIILEACNSVGCDTEPWILKVGSGKFVYADPNLTTGNNDGTDWANAYRSVIGATSNANTHSGDTIIIKDGTYADSNNRIYNDSGNRGSVPPSGTPSAYTTIMAETPGGVLFDGEGSRQPIRLKGSYDVGRGSTLPSSIDISHIAIKGFVAGRSNEFGPISASSAEHIKFILCGAYDQASDSGAVIQVTSSGDVNGDSRINIAEAIMVLKKVSQ